MKYLVPLCRRRRLRIAAVVVATIGLTALIADRGIAAWWLMLASAIAVLVGSVRRGARGVRA